MIIRVNVKFEKRKERVEKIKEGVFNVYIKSPPKEGKANKEVIKELGRYFNRSEEEIKIIRGKKEKKKTIQIN